MSENKVVITKESEYECTENVVQEINRKYYICPECVIEDKLERSFNYCPNCGAEIVWDIKEEESEVEE